MELEREVNTIYSMTGFGRAEQSFEETPVIVELKSVNHRYNDIKARVPPYLQDIEHLLRKHIQKVVSRGRTEVNVRVGESCEPISRPHLDRKLVAHYQKLYNDLKDLLDDSSSPPLNAERLFQMPGVLTTAVPPTDTERLREHVFTVLNQALQPLVEMRKQEGRRLVLDIQQRIELISTQLQGVEARAPELPKEYFRRLQERLDELPLNNPVEPQRLHQEIALWAEKADISEEITRLKSHLKQFAKLLQAGGVIGRRLDFLCQEMHRESNTMGVKAQDSDLLHLLIPIKAEVEKIREQVQNIE